MAAMPWQQVSVRSRVEAFLAQLATPASGPFRCAFVALDPQRVRQQADAADLRRAQGRPLGPLDGLLVAVKDLFDVEGEITSAGSRLLLSGQAPAGRDCVAIARLREAGAVLVGRTNMSEFAFSGLGLNPHFGTPGNPLDPTRVPGGSTAGGAVAVALGWVDAALGTDTSGSVRIPAAFCGLVGWKPTWERLPSEGVFPLARSLDSVGVIARDVQTCALIDEVLAADGSREALTVPAAPADYRLGIVTGPLVRACQPEAQAPVTSALRRLESAGMRLDEVQIDAAVPLLPFIERGGFVTFEAFQLHSARLAQEGEHLDPLVRQRMMRGAAWSAALRTEAMGARREAMAVADRFMSDFDALLLPTTPRQAPRLDEVCEPEGFARQNAASISHTMWANILGWCSLAMPVPASHGGLPGSLMLFGRSMADRRLLAVASAVGRVLTPG